jgi:hypothetical protein
MFVPHYRMKYHNLVTRYTYTKGGSVETITKLDGFVITHSYDGLSRLIPGDLEEER